MSDQTSMIAPGLSTMTVPIDTLIPHPENSRIGDVEAIKASLQANQQYAPVVVQRGTNYIIKGNHTWLAAKGLGWREIAAIAIDCEDEEALQILEVDNLTSDRGTYDLDRRRANWERVRQFRAEVRSGRRVPKLANSAQQFMDLMVADEVERLDGLVVTDQHQTTAQFGETDEEYARRVEAAVEASGGEPGSGSEDATVARALGFREVILMFKMPEYQRTLAICEKIRKEHPEVSSNSAAVLLALEDWEEGQMPKWQSQPIATVLADPVDGDDDWVGLEDF